MTKSFDTFAVENHLTAIAGLAATLDMMAENPNLQDGQKGAIGALADAIQEQHDALWNLLLESGAKAA